MFPVGEQIKDIRGARIREKEKLDRLIVTLSAGTFVLSVTFITGILDIGLTDTWALFASWVCLFSSLFLFLIAYIIVDQHFIGLENDVLSIKKYKGVWGQVADGITLGSVIALIFGMILLALFAKFNIEKFNKDAFHTTTKTLNNSARDASL